MSVELILDLKNIISDENSLKVIATLSPEGVVHAAVKQSVSVDENGQLIYLEFFEKSQTNINMVNSIWYDKDIAITVVSPDKRSFVIKGKPVRTRVFGKEYEKYYVLAEQQNKENDLVAVYYIEPYEIYEQTFAVQQKLHREKYPLYAHLDKYAQ
jgi:hypothetical protein